jgi:hypothetical protein
MRHRITALIATTTFTVIVACGKEDAPVAKAPARPDSSSGEVAQYALMKNSIGWLTDSNVVALATQLNDDAQGMSRLEMQGWTKDPLRYLATQIIQDHKRMQFSIDSIASLRKLPSQMPAVGPELKVPYDSMVNAQAGLATPDREATFTDMVVKEHERSLLGFAALAGNASDPDLRALLANRAVLMEQTHIAQARLIAGAMAKADSARQDSLKTAPRKGGGGR